MSSKGLEIPSKGEFKMVKVGYITEEADSCWIALYADGKLETNNHIWSGPECKYKKGYHRYRVEEDKVKKVVEMLSKTKFIPYEKRSSLMFGIMPIRTVETTDGLFEYAENEKKKNGEGNGIANYLDELFATAAREIREEAY